MSDSPIRLGPPIPPPLASTPALEDAQASPELHEPQPESTPRAAQQPARAISRPAPTELRQSPPRPQLSSSSPADRADAGAIAGVAIGRAVLIASIVALVASAIWFDRGQFDPVAGFGIVPQPGTTEIVALTAPLEVGDLAPNFRLRTADGNVLELADLRGQPVVVQFWTTWCVECLSELPALQELAVTYADRVQVIGVDIGESSSRIQTVASDYHVTYPLLLDEDEEVSRHYGAYTLPTTLVLDANGIIASTQVGAINPADLQPQLDALLAQ